MKMRNKKSNTNEKRKILNCIFAQFAENPASIHDVHVGECESAGENNAKKEEKRQK